MEKEQEKEIREKLKKAINKLFALFEEYEAQFGDYTTKESLLADLLTESELNALTNKKPAVTSKTASKTTTKTASKTTAKTETARTSKIRIAKTKK